MPKSSKTTPLSFAKLSPKDKRLHKELMLKEGKRLFKQGLRAVVLKPGQKQPATRHGVGDAVKSYVKLKRIVRNMEDFNLGVAAGDLSGIIVFDIDRRNGGHRSWGRLVSELGDPGVDLPKVRTGNGFHIYARVAKAGFTKMVIRPGVEVLANRSYALVPSSLHPSGKTYQWVHKLPPPGTKIPKLDPRWLKTIRAFAKRKRTSTSDRREATKSSFREGERNNGLTSLGGKLRRKGHDEAAIRRQLLKANAKRCKPPLPKDEVAKIAHSVAKYPDGKSVADPMERLASAFLKSRFKGGKWLRYEVDDRFWAYDRRIWALLREKTLEHDLLAFMTRSGMGPKTRRVPHVKEVVNYLRVSQAAVDDLLHFRGDPPPVLNLMNGELWLSADGGTDLRKHSWQSGLRSILQVEYKPEAKCKGYDRALTAIFGRAEDPQAMIDLWDEIVGYIIQARRHIPLILILFGTGGNGKTKLVETIRKLLGEDAVYSGSVHDLGKNRFAFSALFGKLLFVDDDVEQGVRLPDGTLKKISEEKDLTADVKHKEMFNFRSRVVPMLLCNNVPTLSDISPGMQRRLMVVEFKQRFTGKREDKDLFPRIWANELPGILNRALRGLARLQRRGRFEQPKDARAGLNAFLGQANPLTAFVEERCTRSPGGQELLQSLYQAYAEWAKESGITRTLQKLTMKRHLANLGYGSKKTNKGQAILDLKLQG